MLLTTMYEPSTYEYILPVQVIVYVHVARHGPTELTYTIALEFTVFHIEFLIFYVF